MKGNAMVEREAKVRERNFVALTQHLATKEGAFNVKGKDGTVASGRGRRGSGSGRRRHRRRGGGGGSGAGTSSSRWWYW